MFFLFNWFAKLGKVFIKIFKSKEAQDVLTIIFTKILPEAKPIVAQIRALIDDPTKANVTDIIQLYSSFGKIVSDIKDNPKAKENAVLNLATELVFAALPVKYKTPWIQAAVNLALSGIKAEK